LKRRYRSIFMKETWLRFRRRFINFYPPLFGAGIRAHTIDDYTTHVEMKLTALNRNLMGVHFGGSLYAMCDPWFAIILMNALGTGYTVWDKSASIQFVKPGNGTVSAKFHIPREQVDRIRLEADRGSKIEPTFTVDVLDELEQIVAHLEKNLYIRKR
jgi:acyl-coenzyme A thioesterase PaaI-like protein